MAPSKAVLAERLRGERALRLQAAGFAEREEATSQRRIKSLEDRLTLVERTTLGIDAASLQKLGDEEKARELAVQVAEHAGLNRRWIVGLLVGLGTAVLLGAINLILNASGILTGHP